MGAEELERLYTVVVKRRSFAGRLWRAPRYWLTTYRLMRFMGRWDAARTALHSTLCVLRASVR